MNLLCPIFIFTITTNIMFCPAGTWYHGLGVFDGLSKLPRLATSLGDRPKVNYS